MTRTARLFDLTSCNLPLEMYRRSTNPLADPNFCRSVDRVSSAEERAAVCARLRPNFRAIGSGVNRDAA